MILTVSGDQFLLDGEPFRILSGSIHYFRVHPGHWRDRLQKLKDFGLNTVETYIPWNMHEPEMSVFKFDRCVDLAGYLTIAQELGLHVIIRPGPFICSEWDFGGLPYWLLKDPTMQVRTSYPPYLEAVDRYFDRLFEILVPFQSTHGGPIIAMQVENEYGGYGNDQSYLMYIREGMQQRGVDVLLFTSDAPYDGNQQSGGVPGVIGTVNFAYNARKGFDVLRQYHPHGPLMVTEFWSGWFDHWGGFHHLCADGAQEPDEPVKTFDDILAAGASVNFYMFHGGTNFGFMNGANLDEGRYQAEVTSYDYAAPLTEWGDASPRFAEFGKVLRKYIPLPELVIPEQSPKLALGKLRMTESTSLWDTLNDLSHSRQCISPRPMEDFDQNYGLILYRTYISGPRTRARLTVHGVHDRAQIFLDGDQVGVFERETGVSSMLVDIQEWGAWLDILVENMGRVNFGPGLMDRKGITGGVTLDGQLQFQWQVYPLRLEYISPYLFQAADGQPNRFPMFFRSDFYVSEPADTFLDTSAWSKGFAWINGFNIGRYWNRGPQKRLYVPGPLLKPGRNELIMLELHECLEEVVTFTDQPDLGKPDPHTL